MVKLIHYTNYDVNPSNNLKNIMQRNIGHAGLYLLWGQSLGHTVSSENITLSQQNM